MGDGPTYVIVGASLAGAKAAEALRGEGFDGRIVLIGEEPVRPYERPPLSKGFLRGEAGLETVFVHDDAFYREHQIDLRLSSTATALDVAAKEVLLASGERIGYQSLLLATGAAPRRLGVPGEELPGVYYLRTLEDSQRLRSAIGDGGRVVVIGAGWIGCEVAASARQMGAEVAIVEMTDYPLQRVLGAELGRFYRDVHAEHGVKLNMGVGVSELRGGTHVDEVVLADGRTLAADAVVIGVGVAPRAEVAETAGLALDNGVSTDEWLQTSSPAVFAAGDVANTWHPILSRRIRLEHWSAALNQGPVAAANMLGRKSAYERIPYFFSDQYDVGMEYTGLADPADRVVFRGDPDSRQFIVFWLRDGQITAGMNVNVWDVADTIAALVAIRHPIDPGRLADPNVDLGDLLNQAVRAAPS